MDPRVDIAAENNRPRRAWERSGTRAKLRVRRRDRVRSPVMTRKVRKHLHEANRRSWNVATRAHNQHKREQAAWLRRGGEALFSEDYELLGPLAGKRLLHLQCNSGQDSLCLARRGAQVTGVDISDEAVAFARELSEATDIHATFERADVFEWMPQAAAVGRSFELVYASYGVLCWLSDLPTWVRGLAELLEPGGRFVLVEFHPFAQCFDAQRRPDSSYFGGATGQFQTWDEGVGDYVADSREGLAPMGFLDADEDYANPHPAHEFYWTLADILRALGEAGLELERFEEYAHSNGCRLFEDMVVDGDRRWHAGEGAPTWPLMFGLVARKPAPAAGELGAEQDEDAPMRPRHEVGTAALGSNVFTEPPPQRPRTPTRPAAQAKASGPEFEGESVPFYQLDAFTDEIFAGNPAAVCVLRSWLPDATLQRIAAENNLSETAFILPEALRWRIRWFTPTTEVELCGHATLASAYVVLELLEPTLDRVDFESASGTLRVRRDADDPHRLLMDFPADPPERDVVPPALIAALGRRPLEVLKASYWMAVYEDEEAVRSIEPDFRLLADVPPGEVIVTAPAGPDRPGVDFVSRFFGPGVGIDEDPVTGSAHCILAPYWAERLNKSRKLQARQVSARGGAIECSVHGDRVELGGRCALYSVGQLRI